MNDAAVKDTLTNQFGAKIIPPRRMLISSSRVYQWLFPALMKVLRARYGTTFYFICARDEVASMRERCVEGDTVIGVEEFHPPRHVERVLDDQAVFAKSRANEARHNLVYMQDILQQDRFESATFLGYAPGSVFGRQLRSDFVGTADYINRCFEYWDAFLTREKIDLAVIRPGNMADTVLVEVAQARGIPVTHLSGARYKSYINWANGPYMGYDHLSKVYDSLPPVTPTPVEEMRTTGSADRLQARFMKVAGRKAFLRTVVVTTIVYAIFIARSLWQWRPRQQIPYWNNIRTEFIRHRIARYLDRHCEKDLAAITERPFIFFPLPLEPEFTVQSLCRKFSDVRALLKQLALCLPAGYNLVIKEHAVLGHRLREFYEQFANFPNVILAHPGIRGIDLTARCAAVASPAGTTPVEAAVMGKRALVFSDRVEYGFLPSVRTVTNVYDLRRAVAEVLQPTSEEEADKFRRAGARYRDASAASGFDATDTVFFWGDKTSLPQEEYERAVDSMLSTVATQRASLLDRRVAE